MCTFESSGGAANFNLTWLKDGTPLVLEPPRVYTKMLTNYQGILVLNKLHPDDKATYTCRGTNNDGMTDADIVLDLYDCMFVFLFLFVYFFFYFFTFFTFTT